MDNELLEIGKKLDVLRQMVIEKEEMVRNMRQDLKVLEMLYDHACHLSAIQAAKKIVESLDTDEQ